MKIQYLELEIQIYLVYGPQNTVVCGTWNWKYSYIFLWNWKYSCILYVVHGTGNTELHITWGWKYSCMWYLELEKQSYILRGTGNTFIPWMWYMELEIQPCIVNIAEQIHLFMRAPCLKDSSLYPSPEAVGYHRVNDASEA